MSNQEQAVGASREYPRAVARARYVRMSPRKVRRVVDLIRGRRAVEALAILKFDQHAASVPVYKVVTSAMANAENNFDLDPDTLVVCTAFVDQAGSFKRIRPRAQGRGYFVHKRSSHITVEVESRPAARSVSRKRQSSANRSAR